MTTSAFPDLTKAEQVFKALIWDNEVTAAEAALFADVPWLGVWPLGPILRYLIEHYSDRLYASIEIHLDTAAIKFVNQEHQRAYDAASERLGVIAHDDGVESPEFQKARDDAKAALSQFVHFNG